MQSALRMYQSLGFFAIEPYYSSPVPDTRFLCLRLT
jgi:hypothetical protein